MGSPYGKYQAGVYQLFRLTDWSGGLNSTDSPSALEDNELQELQNMLISEKGVLKRRYGLRRMNPEELVPELSGLEYGDFNNQDGVNFDANNARRNPDPDPGPPPPGQG